MPRKKRTQADVNDLPEVDKEEEKSKAEYEQPEYLKFIEESNLIEPLSDNTRKQRRHLLLTILIALGITLGNLIPSKVTALGIEVSKAQQTNLHLLLAVVIVYFMVSFSLYGHVDYQQWRVKFDVAQRYRHVAIKGLTKLITPVRGPNAAKGFTDDQISRLSEAQQATNQIKLSENVFRALQRKVFFDFIPPLGGGVMALVLILGEGRGFKVLESPSLWAVSHPVVSTLLTVIIGLFAVFVLRIRDIPKWKKKYAEFKKRQADRRRSRILEKMGRLEKGSPKWLQLQSQLKAEMDAQLESLMRGVGIKDWRSKMKSPSLKDIGPSKTDESRRIV